jgi:hypothetical protein
MDWIFPCDLQSNQFFTFILWDHIFALIQFTIVYIDLLVLLDFCKSLISSAFLKELIKIKICQRLIVQDGLETFLYFCDFTEWTFRLHKLDFDSYTIGKFYRMEFSDFMRNFDSLEICNLTPDSPVEMPKQWHTSEYHGRWQSGFNAGGRPKYRGKYL